MTSSRRAGIVPGTEWNHAFSTVRDTSDEDAKRALEQAHALGLEEGLGQGRREAQEELDRAVERLTQSLETLVTLQQRLSEAHVEKMKALALEAASRMLRQRIAGDDPVAARALEEAVDLLPKDAVLQVRLHPADAEVVRRELAALIEQRSLVLEADDGLQRGGCVVDSEAGSVDATVESAEAAIAVAGAGQLESR